MPRGECTGLGADLDGIPRRAGQDQVYKGVRHQICALGVDLPRPPPLAPVRVPDKVEFSKMSCIADEDIDGGDVSLDHLHRRIGCLLRRHV